MTAAVAAVPEAPSPADLRLRQRLRLTGISVLLMALSFVQDPGRVAADTKLDLAVDPLGFLQRSLSLWEPLGFFGQLQNQAYGYLFPIGPMFVIGDLIALPPWVVQRLWWGGLLVAAFLGAAILARQLGVRDDIARIIAGLAYALAPRMVTEIGVLSVEVLPFALAPWVVIPLCAVADGRLSLRRGAALSGVAVLLAGGVNAVATAAMLPIAAWWILTRFRGRVRAALAAWWVLAVALACAWWTIPLVLLGRYSPPFLDWIESSSVTTLVTTPDTVLRGASQWVAYVVEPGGPVWPSGWQLVTQSALILATGLVAALGIAGLSLRGTPHRLFLAGGALLGVVLVSLGHTGAVQGIAAEPLQDLLDAALAPLRNTHKFDAIVRLPVAVGVGFAVQALLSRTRPRGVVAQRLMVSAAVVLVAAGAWPLLTGTAARDRSFATVPDYWAQAAAWLAEESPDGRALVLPGASFGVYSWGRTQDEPLQPLATAPWAVRDAVPLSSAGNIRWLDAVQERVDSGRGSPRLADALARAGVQYVIVRNDIDRRRSATPRSVLIRQALLRSGGFTPVAGFGPTLPPYRTATTVVDDGLQDTVAAVEVWSVSSPTSPPDPRVVLRDASDVTVVSGSAESVLDLADADVLAERAVVIDGDEAPLVGIPGIGLSRAVTDGFRRTELTVGTSRENRSHTLRADEPFLQDRRVHDYLPVDPLGRQSVAVYDGGIVSASSSGSEVTALRGRSPAAQPWSAIDGDPTTAWVSGQLARGVGEWWEVTTDEPFSASSISVRLVVGSIAGTEPATLGVTTDTGSLTVPVRPTDLVQRLPVPAGETRTLRLTLDSVVDGSQGEAFGLREVDIPGVDITRAVQTPGRVEGGAIVLTARKGEQTGCAAVAGQLVCTPELGQPGEERTGIRRIVDVAAPGEYRLRVLVRPRAGSALDGLLSPALPVSPRASATSVFTSDPAGRPQAATDGVLSTSWIASPLDTAPELTIAWGEPRRIRGVRLDLTPDLVASRPLRVTITVNGRETTDIVSARGSVTIPAQEATSLTVRFDNAESIRSVDPDSGAYTALPIGVNEVRILGAEDIVKGPRLVDLVNVPCGFGPEVVVDGEVRAETAIDATVSSVLTDALITAAPCAGRVTTLTAGRHVIEAMSTAQFAVESLVLEPVGAQSAQPAQAVDVLSWGATEREVDVPAAGVPRLLETTENANPGWEARIGQDLLRPVRVDGWRQAWIVPAGTGGTVSLTFAPQQPYAVGLVAGLLAALALIALAVVPRSRPLAAVPLPTRGRSSDVLLAGAGLLGALLVAGLMGLAVASVAMAVVAVARRGRAVLAGTLAAAAALGAAMVPWPGRLEAPDLLLGAIALLAVAALSAASAPMGSRDAPSAEGAPPG